MYVEFRCEHCETLLSADPSEGPDVQCPSCGGESVGFTLRYEPVAKNDFSRTVEVDNSSGAVKVFAPIYSLERDSFGGSAFLGVETTPDMAACLKLSRVADLHRFPPILYIMLPENGGERPLYQTLGDIPGWGDFLIDVVNLDFDR